MKKKKRDEARVRRVAAIVKRGEAALEALDLSVITQVGHERVWRVRLALRALDDEQAVLAERLEAAGLL